MPTKEEIEDIQNLYAKKEYAKVIQKLEGILKRYPNFTWGWKVLGASFEAIGELSKAIESKRQAALSSPGDYTAWYNLANSYKKSKKFEDAIWCYKKALDINAKDSDIYKNLGACYGSIDAYGNAKECFDKALELNPNDAQIHFNYGIILQKQDLNIDAIRHYKKAVEINPNYAEAYCNLGGSLKDCGAIEESILAIEKAIEINPNYEGAYENLFFALNNHPTKNAEEIYGYYKKYAKRFDTSNKGNTTYSNDTNLNRRLRIGYVSPSFYSHSTRFFLEPLLAGHDRDAFEIYLYSQGIREDEVTKRYKSYADKWIETQGLSDDAMAMRIEADKIDILVDLAGYTAGNRLGVFAQKPAPVSISYLDFGYTRGLEAIDYYLADAELCPKGAESLFAEKIWRLDRCSFVYRPDSDMPKPTPLPFRKNGHITFGTLTRAIRINQKSVAVWARLLKIVPNSKFVVDSKSYKDPKMADRMVQMFEQEGIERDRVVCCFNTPVSKALENIDIGVDCFPHNSGTTLFEMLYMGVPFVTMTGRPSVGRIGASVLQGVCRGEWVANSEEEYIDKLAKLAFDTDSLASIRRELRGQIIKSVLMDEAGFVKSVESAYRSMFEIWSKKSEANKEKNSMKEQKSTIQERDSVVALFNQGRYIEAKEAASKLTSKYPCDGWGWKALGAALLMLKEIEGSIEASKRALELLGDDETVYATLGGCHNEIGEHRSAISYFKKALEMNKKNAAACNNIGFAYEQLRETDKAKKWYLRAVENDGSFAIGFYNLGNIVKAEGNPIGAAEYYKKAIEINPNYAEALHNYAIILKDNGNTVKAIELILKALSINPNYVDAYRSIGACYQLRNNPILARQAYEKALSLDPNNAVAFIGLSDIANDEGDFETSTLLAQKALELDPDSLTALAVIAKNRKMDRDKDAGWLQRAFTLLDKNKKASPQERYAILFSIGKYYDDIKEYDRAFEYYKAANELKKSVIPRYDPKFEEEFAHSITRAYSYSNLAIKKEGSNDSSLPLFIIGMPRSGTSLTEQILSSHPLTFGAGELPFWSDMCARHHDEFLRGEFEAKNLSLMASECIANLKERSKDKPEALRVVDKMPGNFHYIGLILSVFPNAKFIHTMRNPIDTCLSIYFQNFSASHSYSFDLNDLAHYYKEYHRLMEHWRSVLPRGVMLDVRYEDILEDQEGWSRKIIEHIGLEWDDRCLEFYKTDRKVGTASNWQVKQPIYKSSKERWRNYEKFVEPLRGLLEVY